MIITIDGPTASGKSTAARALAHELSIYYVNSGLLYRALAYVFLHIQKRSLEQLPTVTQEDVATIIKDISYSYTSATQEHVYYEQRDITLVLKNNLIDQGASIISAVAHVRDAVNQLVRQIGSSNDLVIDGRDCGTVIFPQATVKFFLTADTHVRAQRWLSDQAVKGIEYSLNQAIDKITERDSRDMQREVAPLQIPVDAIIINDSELTKEQVVAYMLLQIK